MDLGKATDVLVVLAVAEQVPPVQVIAIGSAVDFEGGNHDDY